MMKDVVIVENVKPIKYLANTIINNKIPSNIRYSNGELKSFELDDKQHIINHDVECIRQVYQNLGIEYNGQGVVTLIHHIIEKALGHRILKSHPNNL
eukprot:429939-Hanusia_phi.AAC.1